MAKHPHRLLLSQKKTWRCTLPGCRYFIHLGLAHTLPGQTSVCWSCGEEFTLDEAALQDDMPKCSECRSSNAEIKISDGIINLQFEMKKAGVKSVDDLGRTRLGTMKMLGQITDDDLKRMRELESPKDEVEVIEPTEE